VGARSATASARTFGSAWTPSMDATHVLSVTPGHVPSTFSVVQELLDRLERQAGEIAALHIECDQLQDRIRALAPRSEHR
jgi:hypothetical protein